METIDPQQGPLGPSAEDELLGSENRVELMKKLHLCPEPQREILYLRIFGGLSYREIGEVQVCPYVFYEMCINSDGTHSLCRFDWNHAMLLDGHVGAPVTPRKIWDSIVLWQFQQNFLEKHRKRMTVLSCPNCGILKQGVPEDLDEFAEEIMDMM